MTQRIMVVDDEPQVRELLCMYLMQKGYDVSHADSSSQTLRLLDTQPVDLVLLDISLSDEDGLRFLPILKSRHPKTKVIMLTGMGFVDDLLQEAHQKGADGYIAKGLPMDEVICVIENVLQNKSRTVANRA